jgi:hypothetical protein
MVTLSDRITARALRLALAAEEGDDAARHLADLAGGRPWPLVLALARIHRGLAERPSLVGERAATRVEAALELTEVTARAS